MHPILWTDGSSALQALPSPPPHRHVSPRAITWLTTAASLEPLADAWQDLEASVQHRTVLSTFDYNLVWYGQYGGGFGGETLLGTAYRAKALVGVAPLVVRQRRIGRVPLTCVEFAAHEAYAGEFLVEDDHPDTIALFVDSLARTMTFDLLCLNGIDLTADRFDALRQVAARHRLAAATTDHPNAMVDLSRGYDAYLRTRTSHFRQGVKRHARRVEAAGMPSIEGVQLSQGVEQLEAAIARMIAINEASYKLNGQRLAECHRGFLAGLARRFGPRGMLSLPILVLGGRDAAFVIGLVERGCFYDVTLAYDEAFEPLSPGSHLSQALLRALAAAGVSTFISHGAHEYKQHWATALRPSPRLFLFSPSLRPAVTRFLRFTLHPLWRHLGASEP